MFKGKQMKSKSNNLFADEDIPVRLRDRPFLCSGVCPPRGAAGETKGFRDLTVEAKSVRHTKTGCRCADSGGGPIRCAHAGGDFRAGWRKLCSYQGPRTGQRKATSFANMAHDKKSVTKDPKNPNRVVLSVGEDDWPFPIPIVKRNGKWYFDSKAGRQEILDRRIGANELDAIAICRGYVEAQQEYALEVHDNSGINQYAQRIISQPGKQDGLFWRNADGSPGGPIGEGIAKALEEGYTSKTEPFHGYYFKILKGQGPAAPLGEMNFMVEGVMIGGFALVAVPADYRVTGVKTFIVSYEGIVYQKDLGPDSLNIAKNMELYNPDKTWHRTDDHW